MKTLKNYFLLALVITAFNSTKAQTFSIRGGYNLSNIQEQSDPSEFDELEVDYKMRSGFHVGGMVDISINDVLSVETGLLFTSKGTKFDLQMESFDTGNPLDLEGTLQTYYLDVPITLKYTHQVNENFGLFANAGPYIGIGLVGQTKLTSNLLGMEGESEEAINWGNDPDFDTFKRLDMGLTFGGGVEIGSILVGVSYDLGLANISADQSGGNSIKNKVLKISVGYQFGK